MGQSKPIRVMLVDDHAVVRSGLGAFLMAFDDLELVGEASSCLLYTSGDGLNRCVDAKTTLKSHLPTAFRTAASSVGKRKV